MAKDNKANRRSDYNDDTIRPMVNTHIDALKSIKNSRMGLWRYIVAVCINFLEQKFDIFKEELELIALGLSQVLHNGCKTSS